MMIYNNDERAIYVADLLITLHECHLIISYRPYYTNNKLETFLSHKFYSVYISSIHFMCKHFKFATTSLLRTFYDGDDIINVYIFNYK